MSKISEQVLKYAQEEKQAHEEYIRDFTASTIAHLMQGGVDAEKAALLAKEACLKDDNLVKSVSKSVILEKVAQYIEALETENTKMAAKIETTPVEQKAERPEHLKKLAALGFTDEELDALENVPTDVMQKVASAASEPWEMGRGVGPAVDKTDPLLSWILS
jgi:hypothetical protein